MAVIGVSSATRYQPVDISVPKPGIKPERMIDLSHIVKLGNDIPQHFSLPKVLEENNLSRTLPQSEADQEHLTAALRNLSDRTDDRGRQVWNAQPIKDMANFFKRTERPPMNVVFADIPNRSGTQIYREGFVTSDWQSRSENQYSWLPSSIKNSDFLKDVLKENLNTQMMLVLPRGESVQATAERLGNLLGAAKTALTNRKFPMWTGDLTTFNMLGLQKIDGPLGNFSSQAEINADLLLNGIVDGNARIERDLAPSRTKYIDQNNSWFKSFFE